MFQLLFGFCQCAVARDGKEQRDGKSTGQTSCSLPCVCLKL